MRRTLQLDPESVCEAVSGIEVDIARRPDGGVTLRYLVSGSIEDVLLPQPDAPVRAHQLWEHSCFELFIRPARGEGYCEFNFAPSRQWAAYSFRRHRSGMADIQVGAPAIICSRDAGSFEMRVDLDVGAVPELAGAAALRAAAVRRAAAAAAEDAGEARRRVAPRAAAAAGPPARAERLSPGSIAAQRPRGFPEPGRARCPPPRRLRIGSPPCVLRPARLNAAGRW